MSSITPPIYRTEMMGTIIDDIISGRSVYYIVSGKISPWNDEPNPELPKETIDYQKSIRNNFIECNRLTQNDVSFICRRIMWTAGNVYDYYNENYSSSNLSYSENSNLKDAFFYVMNSENRIYKCIDNNNNSPSTEEPSSNSLGYINTSDGYVWKFMYEINESQLNSFADQNYIPVKNAVKSQFYNPGRISEVNITNPGSGYDPDVTTLSITGDGTGAVLTPIVDEITGELTNVIVDDAGEGYTTASITINSPTGSGGEVVVVFEESATDDIQAAVESSAVPGDISTVLIKSRGIGYSSSDTITIIGNGSGANLTMNVDSETGEINGITILDRGSNYTNIEASINTSTGSGAEIEIVLSPINGHGRDAIRELFPVGISFSKLISNSIIPGQYRQSSIIKNPRNLNGLLFYGSQGLFTAEVTVDTNWSELSVNDIVYDDQNNEFEIVYINNDVAYLHPKNVIEFSGSTVYTDSTIELTITNINQSQINKNTGQLMFTDNKYPFKITPEEFSFFRLYINF